MSSLFKVVHSNFLCGSEILTRSSVGIMIYFPFEFMFLGADCNIENGLSGGWVRKIHREPPESMGWQPAAQMVGPDPEPAPTNGEISI